MMDFECYYFGEPIEFDMSLYELACEYMARTELHDRSLYLTRKMDSFMPDGSIYVHPLERTNSDWVSKCILSELEIKSIKKYGRFISRREITKESSRYNFKADKWIDEWERLNDRI